MPTPTFVGAAAARGSSTVEVNNPAGMIAGDLMLFAAFNSGDRELPASYPVATGYSNQLAEATGTQANAVGWTIGARTSARVWWKIATANDVGGVSRADSDNVLSIALAVYRAASPTLSAAAQVSANVFTTTLTAPSVALPAEGFQTCFFGANGIGGAITVLTPNSPLTQRAATGNVNTHNAASLVADVPLSAGATGSKTATMDDPEGDWSWVGLSVAVIWGTSVAPPGRLFPRDDYLSLGGHHYPPPTSQQRSGRRFGYH